MNNQKILQIIPAPTDMIARKLVDGAEVLDRVICLALVEQGGVQSVIPMIYDTQEIRPQQVQSSSDIVTDTAVTPVTDVADFVEITYSA